VAHPLALLAAILGITALFSSMGVVLASRLRRGESFRTLSAMVTVPLYLFSGIFYPVDTLPLPTRWIAFVNPLTYGVELLRYGVLDVSERSVLVSAALLFALGSVGVIAAIVSFDRSSRG
jgi:ABC-2 type transport system permease protein